MEYRQLSSDNDIWAMLRSVASFSAVISLGVVLTSCSAAGGSRSDGDTSIVLDRSMGGVALREKRVDVEHRLGRGLVLHAADQKAPEPTLHTEDVLHTKYGLEVWYVSRSATKVSRERGRVIVLLTHSPRYRTPDGVHVGSTVAELRTIQGVKCGNLLNLDCQHGGQVHNQPGTMFRLSAPNGVVVRIAIAYPD